MRIDYPVVAVDSEYRVWRAFGNEYWPALSLADAQGRICYHKFGERDYEQSEREIDWANLRSRENCVGYERTEGLHLRAGQCWTNPTCIHSPGSCFSMNGPWLVTGRRREMRLL